MSINSPSRVVPQTRENDLSTTFPAIGRSQDLRVRHVLKMYQCIRCVRVLLLVYSPSIVLFRVECHAQFERLIRDCPTRNAVNVLRKLYILQ